MLYPTFENLRTIIATAWMITFFIYNNFYQCDCVCHVYNLLKFASSKKFQFLNVQLVNFSSLIMEEAVWFWDE